MMKQRSDIYVLAAATAALLSLCLGQTGEISARQILNTNNNVTTTTTPTNSSTTELRETLLPTGKCKEIASCRLRGRRRDLDVGGTGADKTNCFCDQQCKLYDDCCIDSPWTESLAERVKLGLDKLRKRRAQWHCKRINNIFGDIVLRASCMPEWIQKQDDPELANQTVKRCEYVKDRGKSQADENDRAAELDPVGMMMPITDLVSGVTYANSYCLRCNTPAMGPDWAEILRRQKFIYWSPLLECNYNTDSDDRNTLYDLISVKRGQVLKYSTRKNKWTIKLPASGKSTNGSGSGSSNKTAPDDQRVCSIMPTIPDSVEHMVRFCKANLIRSCPAPSKNQTAIDLISLEERKQLQQAKFECQFGHQSITYSLTKKAVYYNPGCAICNHEKRIFCEPKSGRTAGPVKPSSHIKVQGDKQPGYNATVPLFAPPSETEMIESTTTGAETSADELTSAARANSQSDDSSSLGSFSVLFDLYDPPPEMKSSDQGSALANLTASDPAPNTESSGNLSAAVGPQQQQQQQHHQPQQLPLQQQQQQHPQCSEYQVYDPFHLTCRCMICGLNRKFVKGKCVDRSKPPLVYITDICLVVSITSLALYLILYMLSTFDLRPLAAQLARWELEFEAGKAARQVDSGESGRHLGGESKPASNSSKQLTFAAGRRNSGGSNEGSNASGPTSLSAANRQSQSLSTRGVASLAGSLLGAYLLFMFGHQTETGMQAKRQPICAGLAAATYYFFLVAFFWMFLLSYDIWRTLRLATCQLRAPALHSQSSRFLFYALSAIVVSACLVAFAVLIDLLPPPTAPTACATSEIPPQAIPALDPVLMSMQPARNASCTGGGLWTQFVQTYKPNFGHQPGSCWFTNRRSLALFFGFPVALVMLSNLLFFLHSSCMVIRTSSRSSRQFKSSSSPETVKPKFMSLEKGLSNNSTADFTHQNSLTTSSIISVQTLQSHLSASNSLSQAPTVEESAQPLDGDTGAQSQKVPTNSLPAHVMPPLHLPPPPTPKHHAKLDTSLSSNSLATNHSSCSSSHSIASSIAQRCDSHLQSIQSMMGSIGKDYRLYCRLCTIMGLTWLTGLLASLVGKSEFLWYLFVILNTLQGLFIFIAFGCNRSKLYNLKILLSYLKFWLLYRCCLFQCCCCCCCCPASKTPPEKKEQTACEPQVADAGQDLRKGSMSSTSTSSGGNT